MGYRNSETLNYDGNEELFFSEFDGGSGFHSIRLNIFNPFIKEIINLDMQFHHSDTDIIPVVYRSDNYNKNSLSKEREFLEAIKHCYGFLGEQEVENDKDNPEYSGYFWAKNNDNISDGKITIKKYKGKFCTKCASIGCELRDGNVIYTGYYKGGVIGYDELIDEFFVLFYPHDVYSWPTVLKKLDSYLIIGTRGEGLAIINVNSYYIKRYCLKNKQNNDVNEIIIMNSKIIVNNTEEIYIPNF